MAGKTHWKSWIGRRLRLRDLHMFFAVMQSGSMAKASALIVGASPGLGLGLALAELPRRDRALVIGCRCDAAAADRISRRRKRDGLVHSAHPSFQ
jgi:hypothetical protein